MDRTSQEQRTARAPVQDLPLRQGPSRPVDLTWLIALNVRWGGGYVRGTPVAHPFQGDLRPRRPCSNAACVGVHTCARLAISPRIAKTRRMGRVRGHAQIGHGCRYHDLAMQNRNLEYGERRFGFNTKHQSTKAPRYPYVSASKPKLPLHVYVRTWPSMRPRGSH